MIGYIESYALFEIRNNMYTQGTPPRVIYEKLNVVTDTVERPVEYITLMLIFLVITCVDSMIKTIMAAMIRKALIWMAT